MIMQFHEFYIRKASETRNQMKLESNDLYLRSETCPCLKIDKNLSLKLGENMNFTTSTL